MTGSPTADGTFAGYRLLRKLGVGSRADVYLAAGRAGTVALKVFAATVERESVGLELEALSRIESPHLVRLMDVVGTGDELPSLVLGQVHRGSVASLVRARASLERGEAVTILAPIARLVTELSGAGVAHRNIGLTSVHLGSGGEPVLIGLGHATMFARGLPPAVLDAEPAATADRKSLAALAVELLTRVRDAANDPRGRELVRWIESTPTVFEFPAQLEQRLFDWAQSVPIAFRREPDDAPLMPARIAPPMPTRITPLGLVPVPVVPVDAAHPTQGRFRGWLSAELLDDPSRVLRERAIAFLRGVRRRYWLMAAAVLVGLVVAMSLLPTNVGAPTRHADTAPLRYAPTHPAPIRPRPVRTAASLPEDPVQALAVLLRARAGCFHDLSVLCLDDIDEASSAAFASDAAAIQLIQQGGEVQHAAPVGDSVSLTERLGDTALLTLGANSNPASILMIRTKAGWRIRDYLSGRQATNSTPVGPTPGS